MRKKYDWESIQRDYDSGLSQRELMEKYGMSIGALCKARDRGEMTYRSRSEALKMRARTKPPRKSTAETRQKISLARRAYLAANPDKVPYRLNHYSKGPSYPERYFKELFEKENIPLVTEHQISVYQLDFADVERKIDVEIDGDQHYLDKRIIESDNRRNQYLQERGWTVFRIRWSEYQKFTYEEKHVIVNKIKELVAKTAVCD